MLGNFGGLGKLEGYSAKRKERKNLSNYWLRELKIYYSFQGGSKKRFLFNPEGVC